MNTPQKYPQGKVRSVCTPTEAALVKMSRNANVKTLSIPELQQGAKRARKLLEKSQKLAREQARATADKVGVGEKPERTKLKIEIFRETVENYEQRAKKLKAKEAAAKKGKKQPTKAQRATGHRADRAAIRSDLTEQKKAINKKKVAKKTTTKKKVAKKAPTKTS